MTSEYHNEGDISFDGNNGDILVYSNGQWIRSNLNPESVESVSMTPEEKRSYEIFNQNRKRNEQLLRDTFPEDYL